MPPSQTAYPNDTASLYALRQASRELRESLHVLSISGRFSSMKSATRPAVVISTHDSTGGSSITR